MTTKTLLTISLMASPDGQGNNVTSIVFLILIFAMFWFFLIRPQMKKKKIASNSKLPDINFSSSMETGEINYRYPALRTIASVFILFAFFVGLATAGGFWYFTFEQNNKEIGVLILVIGGLIVLFNVAIAESIKVLIDIEYNTRKSAEKK